MSDLGITSSNTTYYANNTAVSSTESPYSANTAEATNDKSQLTIQGYFKLLAAQMSNQDITNPMDTSDIVNQMTQLAMVQTLTSLTEAQKTGTALSKESYAAGMIDKTVVVDGAAYKDSEGNIIPAGTRTGQVESVRFSSDGDPVFTIKGDPNEYSLENMLRIVSSKSTESSDSDSTGSLLPIQTSESAAAKETDETAKASAENSIADALEKAAETSDTAKTEKEKEEEKVAKTQAASSSEETTADTGKAAEEETSAESTAQKASDLSQELASQQAMSELLAQDRLQAENA